VLYVGKSTNMRARVRQYFTASEQRTRMAEMVGIAESVTRSCAASPSRPRCVSCASSRSTSPRYNRRSRFPERGCWIKLTVEAFPRLSIVRAVRDDGAAYLGPFGSSRMAEQAVTALHEAVPLRQCTGRLSVRSTTSACALFEMGRCGAPCEGRESPDAYAGPRDGRPSGVPHRRAARGRCLVATHRDVVAARALRGRRRRARPAGCVRPRAARMQRLAALTRCPHLVAAQPDAGGWQLAVVRHGRLAAASRVPPGAAPRPYLDALVA
jgi:DNA polymerase-3 subunit epsilon